MDNENQIIETEEQADEILESIETPDSAPIADEATPAPASQFPDEYAFTVGGKEIKGKWTSDREKVLKWASMGYEAPNRIGALSKEIESWKAKGKTFEEMEKKYGEIDKYVREKPDFWDHVTKSYNERNQALTDTSNPLVATVNELKTQLQDLIKYKDGIESERQQVRAAREDQAYQADFEGIKKQYPKVDFVTPDADGKSLEFKVLEYAHENGIKNFKTAFRDFYHDELIKMHAEQAKESVIKEKQKNTKLGILGTTTAPTKRMNTDVRGKSYDDIADEAKAELGIA